MTLQRALGFGAVGYLLLILTSSLQALAPFHLQTPEVMLLLVLYLGLQPAGSVAQHVAVAVPLGYLADLFAGSPNGLESLSLGICMVLTRAASSRLIVTSTWQIMAVAALATAGHALLLIGLSSTMYGGGAWAELHILVPTVVTTALVAPLEFALLRRVDRRLSPDPGVLRLAV
jgi:rod shape-determining protein MreD